MQRSLAGSVVWPMHTRRGLLLVFPPVIPTTCGFIWYAYEKGLGVKGLGSVGAYGIHGFGLQVQGRYSCPRTFFDFGSAGSHIAKGCGQDCLSYVIPVVCGMVRSSAVTGVGRHRRRTAVMRKFNLSDSRQVCSCCQQLRLRREGQTPTIILDTTAACLAVESDSFAGVMSPMAALTCSSATEVWLK